MPRAPIGTPSAQDKAQAIALFGDTVSRETWERLEQFVDLLLRWQRSTNLVASSTIPQTWTRHVADSLQLLALVPNARALGRPGSGRGLPGNCDCLRAGWKSRRRGASGRERAEEGRIPPRCGHRTRAARYCPRTANRGFCLRDARAVRRRDGSGSGAARPADRLRNSAVEKGYGRPVSEGTRCRG